MKTMLSFITKELMLLILLLCFVLIVNASIISFDWMYTEQPLIYAANRSIHTLSDFFNIYLHPQMLHIYTIPFFRPFGHFLIYQLLTPLLGWHSTQGLIIVNLFFLALTGYLIIKLYSLLFPGFSMGGYIAFSLYLMHPALMLSRLIVLHFEFAHVFFLLLSLYCFIVFCQQRMIKEWLLLLSLLFYFSSVLFKEPAVMLGPVLASYLFIFFYSNLKLASTVTANPSIGSQKIMAVFSLITLFSLILGLYLSLAWPTLKNPFENFITAKERIAAITVFLNIIFSFPHSSVLQTTLAQPDTIWRHVLSPAITHLILWFFLMSLTVSTILVFFSKNKFIGTYKKSLLFLYISSVLFLILPIIWGMGFPWHLNLTLLFLSLGMGFGGEYLFSNLVKNKICVKIAGIIIAIGVGLTTLTVNHLNINHIPDKDIFASLVDRNAVLHPPDIKNKLNTDSILIVENSTFPDGYSLGASGYPYLLINNMHYSGEYERLENLSYLKYQPIYNGTLFRWAYLMPTLQEEVVPFQIKRMEVLPNEILYNWLQHIDNIFCLGYDKQGNWHDLTATFKKNLLQEKTSRLIGVHQYQPLAAAIIHGHAINIKNLMYPDYQLCQYECDQNRQCKSFTYENVDDGHHSRTQCQFYDSASLKQQKFCASCISFVKEGE